MKQKPDEDFQILFKRISQNKPTFKQGEGRGGLKGREGVLGRRKGEEFISKFSHILQCQVASAHSQNQVLASMNFQLCAHMNFKFQCKCTQPKKCTCKCKMLAMCTHTCKYKQLLPFQIPNFQISNFQTSNFQIQTCQIPKFEIPDLLW